MRFLFDDESFSFETLRAAGFAMYGGSDLGEVLVTVDAITNGDETSWHRAWKATAERVHAAAVRRGCNALAFDGPGTGAALREQKLVFRPDWESVVTPVIDYALTRGEIAAEEIALFGYSLGGYLVARAAAFEHRVAALTCSSGSTRPWPQQNVARAAESRFRSCWQVLEDRVR